MDFSLPPHAQAFREEGCSTLTDDLLVDELLQL